MSDDVVFPIEALTALAEYHETVAERKGARSMEVEMNVNAARTCREALAAHAALRDRLLEK